jgi:hypothetical protein
MYFSKVFLTKFSSLQNLDFFRKEIPATTKTYNFTQYLTFTLNLKFLTLKGLEPLVYGF